VLSLPHPSVFQKIACPEFLSLTDYLFPQVLLRQLDLNFGVDPRDGIEVRMDGGLKQRGDLGLDSQKEVQNLLGEVVGLDENTPHPLSQMDCGITFEMGVQLDVEFEGGDEMLLEILENASFSLGLIQVLRV